MKNQIESEAPIETRQLFHLDEFAEIVRLQQVIWGFADVELVPLRFLVVVSKIGGHVFGAFDAAKPGIPMIGFCFSMPGVTTSGHVYLHSHMLGVLPEYRNTGIGAKILRFLIDRARARGVHKAILHAQLTAEGFYLKEGFNPIGEVFEEAGIAHRLMERNL